MGIWNAWNVGIGERKVVLAEKFSHLSCPLWLGCCGTWEPHSTQPSQGHIQELPRHMPCITGFRLGILGLTGVLGSTSEAAAAWADGAHSPTQTLVLVIQQLLMDQNLYTHHVQNRSSTIVSSPKYPSNLDLPEFRTSFWLNGMANWQPLSARFIAFRQEQAAPARPRRSAAVFNGISVDRTTL